MPAGWTDWALWQYTSSGTVPGIAVSRTDLDALNLLRPGGQQAMARQPVTLAASQVSAGPDPELAYRATGLPPGLRLSATGQVSGTPAASLAAPAAVTITAAWGQVLGQVRLSWAVTGPVTAVAPAARTSVSGAPADFRVPAATVPGGQAAAYTASGLPPAPRSARPGRSPAGRPDQAGSPSRCAPPTRPATPGWPRSPGRSLPRPAAARPA